MITTKEKFPRINKMADFFENTAAGIAGMPKVAYWGGEENFRGNRVCIDFYKEHCRQRGIFDNHFFSSIPFILEEECRLGASILSYLLNKGGGHIYTLGTAEATMARTIGKLGSGDIKTFSCTPTASNLISFNRLGIPQNSFLHIAPYCEIEISDIRKYIPAFSGFDIIVEDTTFQMYSSHRTIQIDFVKKKLKSDGIFCFIEKFNCDDPEEYLSREINKDRNFKARYFDETSIVEKRRDVLETMGNGQVTINEFEKCLMNHFQYAAIIWNSTNFYSIVASNSKVNLLELIAGMPDAFITREFCYLVKLPIPLYGIPEIEIPRLEREERYVV
ncbi:hypothetical protein NSB04_06325 [Blautia pseudococcoides]|nr:hypothetical protein [Blautia pseudococcoides]